MIKSICSHDWLLNTPLNNFATNYNHNKNEIKKVTQNKTIEYISSILLFFVPKQILFFFSLNIVFSWGLYCFGQIVKKYHVIAIFLQC
jgi:hypothetical protein